MSWSHSSNSDCFASLNAYKVSYVGVCVKNRNAILGFLNEEHLLYHYIKRISLALFHHVILVFSTSIFPLMIFYAVCFSSNQIK